MSSLPMAPSSHRDSERTTMSASSSSHRDSERTTSTGRTTLFSASSLPSLEGIDMEAATRASYSSLPPDDDDDDVNNVDQHDEFAHVHYDDQPPSATAALPTEGSSASSTLEPTITTTSHGAQSNATTTTTTPLIGQVSAPTPLPASPRLALAGPYQHTVPRPLPHDEGPTKRDAVAPTTDTTAAPASKRARWVGTEPPPPLPALPRAGNPLATTTTTTTRAATTPTTAAASSPPPRPPPTVYVSKHDEKWFQMLEQLKEYQQANGHTRVPQCFSANPRLGRWVHYQRVEYGLFQQHRKAKINADRIQHLDALGFDWDPHAGHWQAMYDRLGQFIQSHGHARVPKGYPADRALANWVRNQRLERRHAPPPPQRSRILSHRWALLDRVGFVWSATTTSSAAAAATSSQRKRRDDDDDDTTPNHGT